MAANQQQKSGWDFTPPLLIHPGSWLDTELLHTSCVPTSCAQGCWGPQENYQIPKGDVTLGMRSDVARGQMDSNTKWPEGRKAEDHGKVEKAYQGPGTCAEPTGGTCKSQSWLEGIPARNRCKEGGAGEGAGGTQASARGQCCSGHSTLRMWGVLNKYKRFFLDVLTFL